MKTYQRFMTERKGDTAVFTFGRFNPPTVGHEKLIIAVQSVARQRGGDFFVYPSQSQDPKKNPLDRNTKIKYMKKMFSKFSRNIISSNAKTALDVAVELYNKKKYTNLVMVVGSDRVQDFKKLLQTYNGEEKKHGFYDFDNIDVVSAGERDPDAEGVEGMSASKMRAAAVDGDFKSFRMGTPPSLSDADTKKMFNDIRKGMKLDVVKEGKKWKEIDFETESVTEQITLDKTHQITVGSFTTSHLHHSTSAFNMLDEMVNSLSGLSKKDEFYLKEAVMVLDEFLDIRNKLQKVKKINEKDLFFMEQLVNKYTRFMANVNNSDVFDNSFIYKYISEIQETIERGDYPSLVIYTKDTPGQDETVKESMNKVVKYIMDKLNLSKREADKIIQRAMEQGIDVLTIQQKFSMLAPTLTALVSEYKPERK